MIYARHWHPLKRWRDGISSLAGARWIVTSHTRGLYRAVDGYLLMNVTLRLAEQKNIHNKHKQYSNPPRQPRTCQQRVHVYTARDCCIRFGDITLGMACKELPTLGRGRMWGNLEFFKGAWLIDHNLRLFSRKISLIDIWVWHASLSWRIWKGGWVGRHESLNVYEPVPVPRGLQVAGWGVCSSLLNLGTLMRFHVNIREV